MKKILVVFGTRPEAIKMCPVIKELKKIKQISLKLCVTGQHKIMLNDVLKDFGIKPDYNLSIMKNNQDLFYLSSILITKIKNILMIENPDLVLVHGDTTTAYITALSCFYLKIPIGHVEAGLRTKNIYSPYPEEFNRESISLLSSIDFAPTEEAKKNLIKEGKNKSRIVVTGNTGIDSLKYTIKNNYKHKELEWVKGSKFVLLTSHRRENIGKKMHNMFMGIRKILEEYNDVKIIYPVHPNPKVREIAKKEFKGCKNIHLIEPLEVKDFHNFLNACYFVLTDSGGIQEEASKLHKPVLVMRDTTERPEGIKSGSIKLIGTSTKTVYENFKRLLLDTKEYSKMTNALNPYGNGDASIKIKEHILKYFNL